MIMNGARVTTVECDAPTGNGTITTVSGGTATVRWDRGETSPEHVGALIEVADCDACGKERPLSRCVAFGIETFACDECRGAA